MKKVRQYEVGQSYFTDADGPDLLIGTSMILGPLDEDTRVEILDADPRVPGTMFLVIGKIAAGAALSQRYDDASGTTDVGPTTRALYRVLVSGNEERIRFIWAEDEHGP